MSYDPQPDTRFRRWYLRQGDIQNQRLYDALAGGQSMQPRWNLSKILVFALATLVHAVTLLFVVAGVALLLMTALNTTTFCGTIIGFICLAFAWVLRPRFDKLADDMKIVSREQFPTLSRVVENVATTVSTKPPHQIVIDERFNAAWGHVGWRRQGLLILGLPLWEALTEQERIALLAHELAHHANADSKRNWYTWSAINSLIQWYLLLYPDRPNPWDRNPLGFLLLPPANMAWNTAFTLYYLTQSNSRRAEYLADYVAASIAGTDAAIGLIEKLESRPRLTEEVLPGLEATHPPLEFRRKMLQQKPAQSAKLNIPEVDAAKIEAEMQTLVAEINKKLRERHRAR